MGLGVKVELLLGFDSLSGLTSSFMGDGNWHTLDTKWSYEYSKGVGYWKDCTDFNQPQTVFPYNYASSGWADLGPNVLSPSFVGDGNWHTLNNVFSYDRSFPRSGPQGG